MPPSMSRGYCPACNVSYQVNNAWLHRQSKSHQRNVDRLFPLPPSPWLEFAENKKPPRKPLPHLGYLTTPTKK